MPGTSIIHSVNNLLMAFHDSYSKYGGAYAEELDRVLVMYDNISLACGMTQAEKTLAMIFRIKANAACFQLGW